MDEDIRKRPGWAFLATAVVLTTLGCEDAVVPPADGGSTDSGSGGTIATDGGTGGSTTTDGSSIPTDPDELRAACDASGDTLSLGLTKLRRLTKRQINATLRDLLGIEEDAAAGLAPDEHLGPFENNAITPITSLLVEQHQELAKAVAASTLGRQDEITGCSLESEGATCAASFIEEFGRRAFRRPLSAEEVAGFVELYELGESGVDAQNGFRLLMEGFLQSPSFLYHVDVPASGQVSTAPEAAEQYTLASRLSYFLWNSMPDDALLDQAEAEALADPSALEAEITRMLADDKAAEAIALFHESWLEVADLRNRSKDGDLFPSYDDALASAMLAETGRFSDQVIRAGDGLLTTLLTADFTYPEGPLFELYGLTEPAEFAVGDQVSVASTERSGIFTQPAFLTRHAHANQTSPVHRGIIIRENLLCQTMQPPPPGVDNVVPEPNEATTTRERILQHQTDSSCANCHSLIDPLGLAFEHFDAIGAYRTEDGLGAVDASGEFTNTRDDLEGTFTDAAGMMAMMAAASEVQDCVANQWFRFALGRMESLDDACSLVDLHDGFVASGGNIKTLLFLIAQSDAFTHVRSTAGAP